jgi:transcriptional regulator with PAS, ATPase and Fis domain
VIQIDVPPLRERGDDVLLLARYYIETANQRRNGNRLKGLTPEVEKIFLNYPWTGNVRELRNVIERSSILEDSEHVTTTHLPSDMLRDGSVFGTAAKGIVLPPDGIPLETVEAELARQAFERAGGNLTKAAKLLDISRDQLRYKLKKSGQYLAE